MPRMVVPAPYPTAVSRRPMARRGGLVGGPAAARFGLGVQRGRHPDGDQRRPDGHGQDAPPAAAGQALECDDRGQGVDGVGGAAQGHPWPCFLVGDGEGPQRPDPQGQVAAAHGPGQEPGGGVCRRVADPGSGHQRRGGHGDHADGHTTRRQEAGQRAGGGVHDPPPYARRRPAGQGGDVGDTWPRPERYPLERPGWAQRITESIGALADSDTGWSSGWWTCCLPPPDASQCHWHRRAKRSS